jgi:hypothetical protein
MASGEHYKVTHSVSIWLRSDGGAPFLLGESDFVNIFILILSVELFLKMTSNFSRRSISLAAPSGSRQKSSEFNVSQS